MADLSIREATVDDCSMILRFITELAVYEKAEHEVVATATDIKASLFGEDSIAKAILRTGSTTYRICRLFFQLFNLAS